MQHSPSETHGNIRYTFINIDNRSAAGSKDKQKSQPDKMFWGNFHFVKILVGFNTGKTLKYIDSYTSNASKTEHFDLIYC